MRLLILWSLLHLIFHTLSGFIHFLEIGVVESNVLILTLMSQNLQKKPAMVSMMMKMGWSMRMMLPVSIQPAFLKETARSGVFAVLGKLALLLEQALLGKKKIARFVKASARFARRILPKRVGLKQLKIILKVYVKNILFLSHV